MQLTLRPTGERIQLEVSETVRLPWNRSVVLAFEGYNPALKEVDPEDIVMRDYHLGLYGGYVSGMIKQVPPPSLLAYGAAALLRNAAFKDLVYPDLPDGGKREEPLWIHPTGWLEPHPNVWQIPQGQLGGGAVLVRDVTVMAYGRKTELPTSAVEKKALMRSHTVELLEALGYGRNESAGGRSSVT